MEAPQRFTVVVWVGAVSEVVVEWEAVDFTGAVVVADMAAAVVADTGKVKIPANSSPAIALHECDERKSVRRYTLFQSKSSQRLLSRQR